MRHALARDEHAAILTSLSAHGFLRRARTPRRDGAGHREWLHFCVDGGALQLIVNLSIIDDPRAARDVPDAGAEPGARTAPRERVRVLVLARHAGRWRGDLAEIAPGAAELWGGQLRARAGGTAIELVGETITLRGASRDGAIAFDLALAPRTFPSIARDVAIADRAAISWLVVPRLAATGTVAIDGAAARLDGAPAYHDHNWGRFSHGDLAWQWGYAHGDDGHTAVISRLLDRAQSTSYLQALMLWRGPRIERIFRGAELTLRPTGFLRPGPSLVLPRLASLLAGGATEVPRAIAIEARADGDVLRGAFTAEDLARVVVPDPGALRTTVIHEIAGRLELAGAVRGAPVRIAARAIFEHLRSVR